MLLTMALTRLSSRASICEFSEVGYFRTPKVPSPVVRIVDSYFKPMYNETGPFPELELHTACAFSRLHGYGFDPTPTQPEYL